MDGVPCMTSPAIEAGAELDAPISYSLCFASKGTFSIKIRLEEVAVEHGSVSVQAADRQDMPRAQVEQLVHFNVS